MTNRPGITGTCIRTGWFVVACLVALPAAAQFGQPLSLELSNALRVDEPDPAVRTLLERVRANIAERQWDEAIELLRQVMESHGDKMVRLDDRQFISLREYAHRELVELPEGGRALYRGRVDSQAKRWYDAGVKNRDRALLRRVVDELFASSYGDDALLALGEIELEQGHYARARECWERISPRFRTTDGRPLWTSLAQPSKTDDGAKTDSSPQVAWLAYPDSDLNLGDVAARLVLVSILEGADNRAEAEYQSFAKSFPDAKGRLAGRQAPYRETLRALLEAAKKWPASSPIQPIKTFAGNAERNQVLPSLPVLRSLAWEDPISFGETWQADVNLSQTFNLPQRRVAEDVQGLLSQHPLIAGDLVVFHDHFRVYVFSLQTGQPAWQRSDPNSRPGEIFRIEQPLVVRGDQEFLRTFGVPRFTPTISGDMLFVRLGPQTTSWPELAPREVQNTVAVFDLAQQGKKIAMLESPGERWAFEGAPICDGPNVYVALRYNDVRAQSHVACYELPSGELRWRRLVCAAESPGRGAVEEITHNLLTLSERTLYLNTNLGAIASLEADDGRIHWITRYRPDKPSDRREHWFRDLNPCLYHRGTLYVAPSDTPHVLAIDAVTGVLRWSSAAALADIVHLLGVAEGRLIASGRQLWWLDAETGAPVARFPDNDAESLGYGRGLLAGNVVLWPTREQLYVFHQRQQRRTDASTMPAAPRQPIRFADHAQGLTGGNLISDGNYLIVATADRLWAFGPRDETNRPTKPNQSAAR